MKQITLFLSLIIVQQSISGQIDAGILAPDSQEPIKSEEEARSYANSFAANIPGGFIENKGQFSDMDGCPVPEALFKTSAGKATVYLTTHGLTYAFMKFEKEEDEEKEKEHDLSTQLDLGKDPLHHVEKPRNVEIYRMDMLLVGAVIKKENIIAEHPQAYATNFYLGHCPDGIINVKTYSKITIRSIYPGIDWVLYHNGTEGVKYDYVIHPGADPGKIAAKYIGATDIKLERDGSLILKTPLGKVLEGIPVSYQNDPGQKITSRYRLTNNIVQFETGQYDASQTLTIDPPLVWATYYGGTGSSGDPFDGPRSITTDKNGNVYIGGYAGETNFPLKQLAGAYYQSGPISAGGKHLGFIVKFNNMGVLLWSTYYGDTQTWGFKVVTDRFGNVYLGGNTSSLNFPVQNPGGGAYVSLTGNIFIVKFNSSGVRLWATRYNANDCWAMATDVFGSLYVGGYVRGNGLPTFNPGGGAYFQGTSGGGSNLSQDAFILKFDKNCVRRWATYYGGGVGMGSESIANIVTDPVGNVYVTGSTSSSDFPLQNMAGAYNQGFSGTSDAFILKFNKNCVRQWATCYGGNTWGSDITLDSFGSIYVAGTTSGGGLPTQAMAGAYNQAAFGGGGNDLFILKFSPAGARLWATYYGGNNSMGGESVNGIITDQCGNLYLTGTSYPGMPTYNPGGTTFFQAGLTGNAWTAWILLKFDAAGARTWATYYGGGNGGNYNWGEEVAIDPNGCLLATGEAQSGGNPVVNPGGGAYFQSNNASIGTDDGMVLKFCSTLLTNITATNANCNSGSATITATGGTTPYSYTWSNGQTSSTITGLASGKYYVTVADKDCLYKTDSIVVNAGTGIAATISTFTNAKCGNANGTATVSATGGTGALTYSWNTISPQNTNVATGLDVGRYVVTVTDANGCKSITTIILKNSKSEYLSNVLPPDCATGSNGTVDITVKSGQPPYNYQWMNGATSQDINGLKIGDTYSVIITDGNNCKDTLTGTVQLTYTPTTLIVTAPSCGQNDGKAVATASGSHSPFTYLWNTGSISNSISGLSAGVYKVTITDTKGCTYNDSVKYIPDPLVSSTFSISPGNVVCLGSTITFTNTSGITNPAWNSWQLYNYTITPAFTTSGSGNTFTYTFNTPPGTGTFTIVHNTTLNGCLSTTTNTVIVVNCSPVTPTAATLGGGCANSGDCAKSITAGAAGGTAPYTYSWSNGATTSSIAPCATSNSTYTVTVKDAAGATSTSTASITINPAATFTSSPGTTVCMNTTVNFTGATYTGATYSWTIVPASVSGTTPNFSYNFLTTGTYAVTHTVTTGGCQATSTNNVTVINCSAPTVTATGSSICPGSCANVTANGVGGNTPYIYTWSTGATTQNISPCPVANTTYTVTIRDAAGVTATSTAIVTINTGFTATTTSTNTTCYGSINGNASANPGSGTPPYVYNWSNGLGSGFQVSGLSAGTYTVTITDSKGCTATSNATIISPPALTGQFVKGTATCTNCGCKEWVLVNASGGTGSYSYSWPDGYVNRYKNQLCPGPYTINIKDKNGCSVNINLTAP
ncbi:MAG: SBBP repeat-containing protein [Bacteroidetes bacterium]|nr:SBBP repeat-containing protein [Bacteroidota bacterium]